MKNFLRGTNGFNILLYACVLAFYAIALAQPITLASTDLGRHLKNGEIFIQTFSVPQGNYYSYTYPDYSFVNHHWGSGVLFYLIERAAGFMGLHIFSIAIGMATLAIFLLIAVVGGSFAPGLLASLLAVPLAASRAEVRPEVFSYLFAGIFFWAIWNYLEGRITRRWLWILPLLTALWINLHIYFFFGFALIGLGMLEAAYRWLMQKRQDQRERVHALALVGCASVIAAFANPAGIRGVMYPLQIFNNYGYRLLENQSVWFLDRVIGYPPSLYFKILFAALAAACIFYLVRLWQKKESFSPFLILLTLGMSFLGWTAVRNFALFALFAVPLIAIFCRSMSIKNRACSATLFRREILDFGARSPGGDRAVSVDTARASRWASQPKIRDCSRIWGCRICSKSSAGYYVGLILGAGCLFVALFVINPSFWDRYKDGGWGIGLHSAAAGRSGAGVSSAADFFKREGMHGPIFNNYDIGGYLIYYLFPDERVFVDNRPEAYPASFFTDVYVPMQEREDTWQEESARFNFNAIIFYWHDLTPWAQAFLARRVADAAWSVVYGDDRIIIFARRGSVNQSVIDKYEIPRSAFQFAPSL